GKSAEMCTSDLKYNKELILKLLKSEVDLKIENLIMPNLYNNQKNDGRAMVGAVFRLIKIQEYSMAATVLLVFLTNETYSKKLDIIKDYIAREGNDIFWQKFVGNAHTYTVDNNNILSIFAQAKYNNNETKDVISFIEIYVLKLLEEKTVTIQLRSRDSQQLTPIMNAMEANIHAAAIIKLFINQLKAENIYDQQIFLTEKEGNPARTRLQLITAIKDDKIRAEILQVLQETSTEQFTNNSTIITKK
ncbi:MAG: hypothetical protein ACK4PR_13025, partial [Gammaproteobacteria bacterium]